MFVDKPHGAEGSFAGSTMIEFDESNSSGKLGAGLSSAQDRNRPPPVMGTVSAPANVPENWGRGVLGSALSK